MRKSNLTYRKSGVNIKAADKFVNYISSLAKKHNNNKESKNNQTLLFLHTEGHFDRDLVRRHQEVSHL